MRPSPWFSIADCCTTLLDGNRRQRLGSGRRRHLQALDGETSRLMLRQRLEPFEVAVFVAE